MEHFSKQRITIWCGSERAVKYHVGKQTQAKTEIYTESNTEAITEFKEKRMGCRRKNTPRFEFVNILEWRKYRLCDNPRDVSIL